MRGSLNLNYPPFRVCSHHCKCLIYFSISQAMGKKKNHPFKLEVFMDLRPEYLLCYRASFVSLVTAVCCLVAQPDHPF